MAFEIVPFESIKDLLGLKNSLPDYPDLAIIKASVAVAIEKELGRSLERKERTEDVVTGTSKTRYIDLLGLPVVSVSEVLIDGVTLDAEYYKITAGGLRLKTAILEADVSVTYIGGYENTAPDGIERAALMQTCYEYQNKDNIGASSVTTEGGSVQTPALSLLPMVLNLLDGYKHPARIS